MQGTYAIYQGLSTRRLCKEHVRRKVNNAPGVDLRRKFAFARNPSSSPGVITGLEPAIQSKTSTRWAVNFKKNIRPRRALNLRPIWARDTVQRIPCFDSCQLTITWRSTTKDVPMVMMVRSRKESFSAFWPRGNWSESKSSTKQGVVMRERTRSPATPRFWKTPTGFHGWVHLLIGNFVTDLKS